jgi:hypothetical protein
MRERGVRVTHFLDSCLRYELRTYRFIVMPGSSKCLDCMQSEVPMPSTGPQCLASKEKERAETMISARQSYGVGVQFGSVGTNHICDPTPVRLVPTAVKSPVVVSTLAADAPRKR